MEQTKEADTKRDKFFRHIFYGTTALTAFVTLGLTYLGYLSGKEVVSEHNQFRYAVNHLDQNAVSPKKSPFSGNGYLMKGGLSYSNQGRVVYRDRDNDGDYDSILIRKNSDGGFVELLMQTEANGEINFPTLSNNAVNPLTIIEVGGKRWTDKDYRDLDGNGTLESIVEIGTTGNLQTFKVEIINGKLSLSNVSY